MTDEEFCRLREERWQKMTPVCPFCIGDVRLMIPILTDEQAGKCVGVAYECSDCGCQFVIIGIDERRLELTDEQWDELTPSLCMCPACTCNELIHEPTEELEHKYHCTECATDFVLTYLPDNMELPFDTVII